MLVIVLLAFFISLSGCGQSYSVYSSPSPAITPSLEITQSTPSPYLPSLSSLQTLSPGSSSVPNYTPEPVPSPGPMQEAPAPSSDKPEETTPVSTATTPELAKTGFSSTSLLQVEVPSGYKGKTNPYPWNNGAAKEAGKAVFTEFCKGCHGESGNLQRNVDFTDSQMSARIKDMPDYFFWRTSEGKQSASGFNMPAFKGLLKEEERWQVITYIQSMGEK